MKNFRLCRHLLFFFLLTRGGLLEAQLFAEDFEGYAVGDYISIVGAPAWTVWVAGNEGGDMDAQVSDEAALSGAQSLKIFGNVAGGPMDIVLVAGLEGAFEVTFNVLVPQGNSGYYNFQENQIVGTDWAFECNLNADGTINYNVDGTSFASSTFVPGVWLKVTHLIDTDSDLMDIYLDDVFLAQLPYDGVQIGGVNFYAAGDGINVPTYYIDDVVVDVTDPVTVWQQEGCTDANACNYNPAALVEDGSCDYSCFGCTDAEASNYDASATVDDGSCTYFAPSCDYLGAPEWNDLDLGVFTDESPVFVQGVAASYDLVLNVPEVVLEPGTGSVFALQSWTPTGVLGLPEGLTLDDVSFGAPGTQQCLSISGTGWEVGTYEVVLQGDLLVSVFGSPYALGNYPLSFEIAIVANPNGIPGCTYSNATNFQPFATLENGSCLYAGCTDPAALNYYSLFVLDDGSCIYGDLQDNNCPTDVDGDGVVSTTDLLELLGSFGTLCY